MKSSSSSSSLIEDESKEYDAAAAMSSDEDAEANEDLSLKIVERAMQRANSVMKDDAFKESMSVEGKKSKKDKKKKRKKDEDEEDHNASAQELTVNIKHLTHCFMFFFIFYFIRILSRHIVFSGFDLGFCFSGAFWNTSEFWKLLQQHNWGNF